jgi:excisionase family DNA binding protein
MVTTLEKRWLSYREAEQYCGIGRTRMWELLRSSKVKAAKDGARVRIDRESLDAYLEQQNYTHITAK